MKTNKQTNKQTKQQHRNSKTEIAIQDGPSDKCKGNFLLKKHHTITKRKTDYLGSSLEWKYL